MSNNTTKSLFWSFMEQGSSKAIAMIVQIVLARLLSPEAFGVLAILLVVTNIADSIALSGLGSALIQKSDADDESYDTAFLLSMSIALVLYTIIFFGAPAVATFYDMPELVSYLRVLALILFVNAGNSIQRSYLQKRLDFRRIFLVSLSAVIISGAVGIFAAVINLGVWALVLQTVVQSGVTFIAMLFVVPWTPRLRFNVTEAKSLFSYGWKVCITSILGTLYTGVSELIIGKSCSKAELGLYSQGRKYPHAAIGVMTNAMANVLFPSFAKAQGNRELLIGKVRTALLTGTLVVAPMSLWCAVIAKPLVSILLGEKWLQAIPIFQLTCISNAFLMLQLVNLRAYMALGKSDIYLNLQTLKVIIGIVIIGGTAFATGSIYATAVSTTAVSLISITIIDMQPAGKIIGYNRFQQLKDTLPIFLSAMLAAAVSYPLSICAWPHILMLVLQTIIYGVSFVALSRRLVPEVLDSLLSRIREVFRSSSGLS